MPLHKVEDLFAERPRMLISLVESLLRKKMAQQAAGIWIRNKLGVSKDVNEKIKEEVEAIPYD